MNPYSFFFIELKKKHFTKWTHCLILFLAFTRLQCKADKLNPGSSVANYTQLLLSIRYSDPFYEYGRENNNCKTKQCACK